MFFKQADGSIVGMFDELGVKHYILPTRQIVKAQPSNFIVTNRVTEDAFDDQLKSVGLVTVVVLEEYNASNAPTGKLIRVKEDELGEISYEDLSDGSAYTKPAGYSLHKSADYEFSELVEFLCDNGVTVKRVTIYRNGNVADVASTLVTTASGATHTLSANALYGNCNDQKEYDHQARKFSHKTDVTAPRVDGYIRYVIDKVTGDTSSAFFTADDQPLSKTDYEPSDCQ